MSNAVHMPLILSEYQKNLVAEYFQRFGHGTIAKGLLLYVYYANIVYHGYISVTNFISYALQKCNNIEELAEDWQINKRTLRVYFGFTMAILANGDLNEIEAHIAHMKAITDKLTLDQRMCLDAYTIRRENHISPEYVPPRCKISNNNI